MKKITLIILIIIAGAIFTNCNKDDDNQRATADSIVGTWKLIEVYSNGAAMSVNSCDLLETYIFGDNQFTHETYSSAAGRYVTQSDDDDDDDDHSSDDDDDEDDDHSDDDSDDDSDDNTSDDNSDDDSDDDSGNGGGSGNCVLNQQQIGFWTVQDNNYIFNIENVMTNNTIFFIDNGNKFYFEEIVTVNGVQVTKRYVFQRQ